MDAVEPRVASFHEAAGEWRNFREALKAYDAMLAQVQSAFATVASASDNPFAAGGGSTQFLESALAIREQASHDTAASGSSSLIQSPGACSMATKVDVDNLVNLTRAQLTVIAKDFRQPHAVQQAAAAALEEIVAKRLREAVADWESAASSFTAMTQQLVMITDAARKNPGSDGVAQLTLSIRKLGDLVADIGGFADHEPPPSAEGDKAGTEMIGPDSAPPPAIPALAAPTPTPPIGTVRASTKLAETADEYLTLFQTASIDGDQATDRRADLRHHCSQRDDLSPGQRRPQCALALCRHHSLARGGVQFWLPSAQWRPADPPHHHVPAGDRNARPALRLVDKRHRRAWSAPA